MRQPGGLHVITQSVVGSNVIVMLRQFGLTQASTVVRWSETNGLLSAADVSGRESEVGKFDTPGDGRTSPDADLGLTSPD